MALNSTTYSPFDQLAFRSQGRGDEIKYQDSKGGGKKGKKKVLGVVSEVEVRSDMPEYTTADFIEESKREEEQSDGYRVVKKGPKFEDMDDFE